MGKPLSVLKDLAGEKALESSTKILNKMTGWMNNYYEKIWKAYNWKEIIVIDEALVLTSGTIEQVLPKEVGQLITFTERATNTILQPTSPFVYQEKYLSELGSSASPMAYVEAGKVGVNPNLSTADTLTIVSNSTSDVHIVRVTGKDANNLLRSEAITLNGTSSVAGTITFKSGGIIDVVQSQRSSGTITVSETNSATTLTLLGPEIYNNECLKIRLQSPVDSARTTYVTYKERFHPLRYDQDVPRFDCGEALIQYAYAQVLKTRGKFDQALVEERATDEQIASLVAERDILGADLEQSLPRVGTNFNDFPYFGGGY